MARYTRDRRTGGGCFNVRRKRRRKEKERAEARRGGAEEEEEEQEEARDGEKKKKKDFAELVSFSFDTEGDAALLSSLEFMPRESSSSFSSSSPSSPSPSHPQHSNTTTPAVTTQASSYPPAQTCRLRGSPSSSSSSSSLSSFSVLKESLQTSSSLSSRVSSASSHPARNQSRPSPSSVLSSSSILNPQAVASSSFLSVSPSVIGGKVSSVDAEKAQGSSRVRSAGSVARLPSVSATQMQTAQVLLRQYRYAESRYYLGEDEVEQRKPDWLKKEKEDEGFRGVRGEGGRRREGESKGSENPQRKNSSQAMVNKETVRHPRAEEEEEAAQHMAPPHYHVPGVHTPHRSDGQHRHRPWLSSFQKVGEEKEKQICFGCFASGHEYSSCSRKSLFCRMCISYGHEDVDCPLLMLERSLRGELGSSSFPPHQGRREHSPTEIEIVDDEDGAGEEEEEDCTTSSSSSSVTSSSDTDGVGGGTKRRCRGESHQEKKDSSRTARPEDRCNGGAERQKEREQSDGGVVERIGRKRGEREAELKEERGEVEKSFSSPPLPSFFPYVRCLSCGQKGHVECGDPPLRVLQLFCCRCGVYGHTNRSCIHEPAERGSSRSSFRRHPAHAGKAFHSSFSSRHSSSSSFFSRYSSASSPNHSRSPRKSKYTPRSAPCPSSSSFPHPLPSLSQSRCTEAAGSETSSSYNNYCYSASLPRPRSLSHNPRQTSSSLSSPSPEPHTSALAEKNFSLLSSSAHSSPASSSSSSRQSRNLTAKFSREGEWRQERGSDHQHSQDMKKERKKRPFRPGPVTRREEEEGMPKENKKKKAKKKLLQLEENPLLEATGENGVKTSEACHVESALRRERSGAGREEKSGEQASKRKKKKKRPWWTEGGGGGGGGRYDEEEGRSPFKRRKGMSVGRKRTSFYISKDKRRRKKEREDKKTT